MVKATANAIRLLSALKLLPLEQCTPDAAEWQQDIAAAIRGLRGAEMPPDDPLRYGEDGLLLSPGDFQAKLEMIVGSMTNWKEDRKRGRSKSYPSNR
jgi:hypothetical protein|tara:strand:+ start:2312 stop:2602 length:291 start_codon:yes stop_codon:yes gene_type:complete